VSTCRVAEPDARPSAFELDGCNPSAEGVKSLLLGEHGKSTAYSGTVEDAPLKLLEELDFMLEEFDFMLEKFECMLEGVAVQGLPTGHSDGGSQSLLAQDHDLGRPGWDYGQEFHELE
jgi:hypothetical protein